MITAILILFAAICKAFVDTLDHHFDTSVFKHLPRKWYDPNILIKSAPQIFGYPLDAWHIGNSLMIFSFIFAAVFYKQETNWYWEVLLLGTEFNLVFNVFYNKIFR